MKKGILVLLIIMLFTLSGIKVYALPPINSDIVTIGHYDGIVNGEIKNSNLKNDLDSLLFAIDVLEDFAHGYNDNQTINYYNNLILSYCRGININYTDDGNGGSINERFNVWNAVMGTTDNDFIVYVSKTIFLILLFVSTLLIFLEAHNLIIYHTENFLLKIWIMDMTLLIH